MSLNFQINKCLISSLHKTKMKSKHFIKKKQDFQIYFYFTFGNLFINYILSIYMGDNIAYYVLIIHNL